MRIWWYCLQGETDKGWEFVASFKAKSERDAKRQLHHKEPNWIVRKIQKNELVKPCET